MPAPFIPLSPEEFDALLDEWFTRRKRTITAVHMHHTWRPNHSQYEGHESIVAMWKYHTQTNGWSDIAQHVTIAPDGKIWTGRHWDSPPASSRNQNGTNQSGPFMFEMIGDFDQGRDRLEGPQRDAALWVISLVQDRFELPIESLKFHNQLGSPKTCPGTSISYAGICNEVRARRGTKPPRSRAPDLLTRNLPGARAWLASEPPPAETPTAEPAEDEHDHGGEEPEVRALDIRGRRSLDAETLAGLRPHVINLWSGRLSDSGIFQTDAGDIDRIFGEELPRRVAALPEGTALPIVLYAHGGLVDEESGLRIAANQVPWWNANGCYPLQFVWETGLLESIARMLGAQRAARGLDDLTDPVIEAMARAAGGPRIWASMKYAAASAFQPGAAGTLVAERLANFLKQYGEKTPLYAIGHSAGSIFHAHLLSSLRALDALPVEELFLLAPAITVADYKRLIDPLVGSYAKRLLMFTMAKDFELADTVTAAYRKSLLYLIQRALESKPGEPILGLEECLRGDPDLARRFGLGGAASDVAAVVWSQTRSASGRHASRATSHGGFDNDVATMESLAREILGTPDNSDLQQRFPPDTENRTPTLPAGVMPSTSVPPPDRVEPSAPQILAPTVKQQLSGRRALCVGINDYPDPANHLRGCVADAQAWEAALSNIGFAVESLHDLQATRSTILGRLTLMINEARPGEAIVFQYAGHGTHVPDLDRDEVSGEDQALCPVDFEDGQLLIDDDIRAVFESIPEGVIVTCFMDNCYSYSNTRFAVGKAAPAAEQSRPRFIKLRPEVVRRYNQVRSSMRTLSRKPGTPEEMRWIAFSACDSNEVAYETEGRGDFSRSVVPLLAQIDGVTNQQFYELVTSRFGTMPRQHPRLDCRQAAQGELILVGGSRSRARGIEVPAVPGPPRRGEVADLLEAVARLLR